MMKSAMRRLAHRLNLQLTVTVDGQIERHLANGSSCQLRELLQVQKVAAEIPHLIEARSSSFSLGMKGQQRDFVDNKPLLYVHV
jgi:hypothetical protein